MSSTAVSRQGLRSVLSSMLIGSTPSLPTVVPKRLANLVPTNLFSHALKALGVIFLVLNLKNLPMTWHLRVLRALLYQIHLAPRPMARADLFKPIVTTTWNSLLDCDYNLHKSNSTYLKDLDVSRAHFISAVIRTGLRRLQAGDYEGLPSQSDMSAPLQPSPSSSSSSSSSSSVATSPSVVSDNYIVALGGVACVFRKEIAPLARFEIWTRLLAWDEKWLYTVSHVVKAGAVRPSSFAMQPWKNGSMRAGGMGSRQDEMKKKKKKNKSASSSEEGEINDELRRAVYATSIARYVCKKGRAVIPPELVLERSRLLPEGPRPAHVPDLRSGVDTCPAPKGEESSSPAHPPTVSGPESGVVGLEGRLGRALDGTQPGVTTGGRGLGLDGVGGQEDKN